MILPQRCGQRGQTARLPLGLVSPTDSAAASCRTAQPPPMPPATQLPRASRKNMPRKAKTSKSAIKRKQ